MAKYDALHEFLHRNEGNECELSFSAIERIIGDSLPETARKKRQWWANQENPKGRQCRAWMSAGWRVADGGVNFGRETVLFVRAR